MTIEPIEMIALRGLMIFKNALGVEPSPSEVPLDFRRCQARVLMRKANMGRSAVPAIGALDLVRCENVATCVSVDNQPGADSKVAAMSLCDLCRDSLIREKGVDHAHITSLTVPAPIAAAPFVVATLRSPRAVAPTPPGKR